MEDNKEKTPRKQDKEQDDQEVIDLVVKTNKMDDRSSVIVLVSYLDARLTKVIAKKMVDSLENTDELLDESSLFGSLGIKIKLAYRLGLISSDFFKTLRDLSWIRNKCAHKHSDVIFEQDDIKHRIENIAARMKKKSHPDIMALTTKKKFEQIFIGSYILLKYIDKHEKSLISSEKEPMFE